MNAEGGYTRNYRRMWDNPVFRSKVEAAVFSWMISTASWRGGRIATKFGPVNLEVGELLVSERELAADFGMHRNTLRSLIHRMVDDHIIEAIRDRSSARAGTIVRIVKYREYQGIRADCGDGQDQKRTASSTEAGPQEDHKRTKIKEGKEGKEGKKEEGLKAAPLDMSPPTPIRGEPDLLPTAEVVRVDPDQTREAVGIWNAAAEQHGLSQVRTLTEQRRRSLRLRLRECGGIEGWRQALALIGESGFLRGESRTGWKADLDFIIQPSSFAKLREGTYGNRGRGEVGQSKRAWIFDEARQDAQQQPAPEWDIESTATENFA